MRFAGPLGPRHVEHRMADLIPQARDALDLVVHLRRAALHREQADPVSARDLREDAWGFGDVGRCDTPPLRCSRRSRRRRARLIPISRREPGGGPPPARAVARRSRGRRRTAPRRRYVPRRSSARTIPSLSPMGRSSSEPDSRPPAARVCVGSNWPRASVLITVARSA